LIKKSTAINDLGGEPFLSDVVFPEGRIVEVGKTTCSQFWF